MSQIPQSCRFREAVIGWKVFPLLGNICSCGMGQLTNMCFIDAKKDRVVVEWTNQLCRHLFH